MVNQDLDPSQKGTPDDITNPSATENVIPGPTIHDLTKESSLIASSTTEFLGDPLHFQEPFHEFLTGLSQVQHPVLQGIDIVGSESYTGHRSLSLYAYAGIEENNVEGAVNDLFTEFLNKLCSNRNATTVVLGWRFYEGKSLEDIGGLETPDEEILLYRARIYNPSQERKDTALPQMSPREAYISSSSEASGLLDKLGYLNLESFTSESDTVLSSLGEIGTFFNSLATMGTVVFTDTERYERDMLAASQNAVKRPFGIEISTLSDNLQAVLYPRMIFQPRESDIEFAKEMEVDVRTEGPQAMLYPLDGIVNETENIENNAANLLFVGHLVDALLTNKYPLERDAQSAEFIGVLKQGLEKVQGFVEKLSPEQRAKLSSRIARIGLMDSEKLAEYAWNYATYRVEEMREYGLIASEGELYIKQDAPGRTPLEAVSAQKEYLRLSDGDLQERPHGGDTPSLPWKEYGTNRYNRDHQLLGRYKHVDAGLVVDFRLDTTHMPASYGFFDTIEIASRGEKGPRDDHIILGQKVNHEKEALLFWSMFGGSQTKMDEPFLEDVVFPIVVAGEFRFKDPALRPPIEGLINDPGTKPEIAKVIRDTMRLDSEGKLQRVPEKEE